MSTSVQTGWLIEYGDPVPYFLTLGRNAVQWTTDHLLATRFADEASAKRAVEMFSHIPGVRMVLHSWTAFEDYAPPADAPRAARKVVQIAVRSPAGLYALCDDGSIWAASPYSMPTWLPVEAIPQD